MMIWEEKLRKWLSENLLAFAYVAILLIGLFLRVTYFPFLSEDLQLYNVPWLQLMRENGIAGVFREDVFFNYSPLHLFLWTMVAKCTGTLDPLMALKTVGLFFDCLLCFGCWRIVCTIVDGRRASVKKFIAFALIWLNPVLIWNAAAWGQTDVIYGFFCILSLLLLLKEKPVGAVLLFAVAFSFKMQALFLFPLFLFVYFSSRKKCSALWFLTIPAMLLLTGLPLLLVDQSPLYAVSNYMEQIDTYTYMTYNYPNFFAIVGDIHHNSHMVVGMHNRAGMVLCLAALGCMLVLIVKKQLNVNNRMLLQLAVWCVWCCVMLLPRMHERYGFVGEMLLLCWAVSSGKARDYLCLALNVLAILSAYASYLFGSACFTLQIGGVLNGVAFCVFTWNLIRAMNAEDGCETAENRNCITEGK